MEEELASGEWAESVEGPKNLSDSAEGYIPVQWTRKKIAWRCTICGYIEEGYPDGLPEGYMCPICGAPREMFERVEL